LVRRGRALRDRDRTLARAASRRFGPALPSHSIVLRGSLRGAAQFALLGPGGVDVAIRWRPLRSIRSPRTLCPRAETYFGTKPSMLSARRRLATSWVLTLRAPSFHVGAGRAFTRCVPTSDVSCRHPAPARRLLLPTASFSLVRCSRAYGVSFTERPESFHRPLVWRSHLLCREKMEERLEASSVVSKPLPASADPHGLSAVHTRRLAAPDRVIRHAFPVTFELDACAPFRSGAWS